MSSNGWGGVGHDPWSQGPDDGNRRVPGNAGEAPQNSRGQGSPASAPHGSWGQGSHPPSVPNAPHPGPGSGGRPRSTWPWLIGALGCVLVLVLGIALGGGVLWMNRGGDKPTATPTTSHAPFTSFGIGATPPGDAADWKAVLADNPYLDLEIPLEETACSLPDVTGQIPPETLPEYLRQANECMFALWKGPMSEAGFEWNKPRVTVYDPAAAPPTECSDLLLDNLPILCFSENTIYWPTTAVIYESVTDPTAAENKQMVLHMLAHRYAGSTFESSGLFVYYLALVADLDDSSPEYQQYTRRLQSQLFCVSAASGEALPKGLRPEGRVRTAMTSEFTSDGDPIRPAPRTIAHWVETGFSSPGDLSVCDSWSASDDDVA